MATHNDTIGREEMHHCSTVGKQNMDYTWSSFRTRQGSVRLLLRAFCRSPADGHMETSSAISVNVPSIWERGWRDQLRLGIHQDFVVGSACQHPLDHPHPVRTTDPRAHLGVPHGRQPFLGSDARRRCQNRKAPALQQPAPSLQGRHK